MKNLSIILVCLLVPLISCTKSKEVHPELGDGNVENVTVGMTNVHVEYIRKDHAELSKVMFHYCPSDANGNNVHQFEVAEMSKKETFFELTLNDLLKDTLYRYYYELFPNSGDAMATVSSCQPLASVGTASSMTLATAVTTGQSRSELTTRTVIGPSVSIRAITV